MKNYLLILLLSITTTCLAGMYIPKEGNSIILQLTDNVNYYKLQESDINYQKQLFNKIQFDKFKSKGGIYKTFILCNHKLIENGINTPFSVFTDIEDPTELLVYTKTEGKFVIKLNKQQILSTGLGGISFHMHPSKKAVTVLIPIEKEIIGVVVTKRSPKTYEELGKPIFKKNSVEWW